MPSSLFPEVQLIWACLDRSLVGPLMWGVCQSRRFCWPWPAVLTPASGDQLGVGWARTASTDSDGDPPPRFPGRPVQTGSHGHGQGEGSANRLSGLLKSQWPRKSCGQLTVEGALQGGLGRHWEVRGAGTWGHSCHLAHSKASLENKAVCRLRAMRGL